MLAISAGPRVYSGGVRDILMGEPRKSRPPMRTTMPRART